MTTGWGPARRDLLVALSVVALAMLELLLGPGRASASPAAGAVALAVLLPLVWRTTRPVAAAVASAGSFAVGTLLVTPAELFVVGVVVFLLVPFSVAAHADRWRTAVAAGVVVVGLLALQGVWDERYSGAGAAVANLAYGCLGWGVGAAVRVAERRSEGRAALAERRAAEALAAERAAMARDLHDVVSTALTVVAVQSGGALRVLDDDPAQARRSLEDIRDVSRRAMVDMRHLLGLLRTDAAEQDVVRRPGLDALEELVAPLERAGTTVSLHRHGTPGAVSPGTETTAVRVLQEALTNVVRHSAATEATVTVGWGADGLELCVADRGPARRTGGLEVPGGGHGLRGMRERVDLLGGRLDAGPDGTGGWRVRARLPVERSGGSA